MGAWTQAKELAAQTPSDRNRCVDFVRAVSILAVIAGHWLVAALYYHDGSLTPEQVFTQVITVGSRRPVRDSISAILVAISTSGCITAAVLRFCFSGSGS